MDELAFDSSSDGWSSTTPSQSLVRTVFAPDDLLSPLEIGVIIGCLIFVGIIVVILRRKRRLDRLRSILLPMYTFDSYEADNWDTELLEPDSYIPTCDNYLESRRS